MVVAALFLLFLIFSLFLPLRLYIRADGTPRIALRIYYWKIPIKRLAIVIRLHERLIPYVYLENKKLCSRIFPKPTKKNRRRVPLLHAVLWAYRTEKLNMNIVIGTGDAAATAYAIGFLRIAAESLKLRLHDGERAELIIAPNFERMCFYAVGECIISALPANIIRKAIIRKADNKKCTRLKTFSKAQ